MKNKFHFFFLLLIYTYGSSLNSQTTYDNEWINHDLTYHKFEVAEDGLVQISFDALSETGLALEGEGFRVFSRGEEVPIYVTTNGTFETNDYIEFVGQKNDGYYDTQMYEQAFHQPQPTRSLYFDPGVYYLTSDNTGSAKRIEQFPTSIPVDAVAESNFQHRESLLFHQAFFQGQPDHSLGSINNFSADMEEGEGFVSTIHPGGISQDYLDGFMKDFSLELDFIDENFVEGPAQVRAKIMGRNNNFFQIPDHRLKLHVNGTEYVDDEFEGYSTNDYLFEVPQAELTPSTIFSLEGVYNASTAGDISRFSIANIHITYARQFNFSDEKSFSFNLEADEDKYIEITNFDGGNSPVLYDLTLNRRYFPETGSTPYKFYFPQSGSQSQREFFISNTTATNTVQLVDSFEPVTFRDFSNLSEEGDYIILYHESLTTGAVNEVQRYIDYRSSSDGGAHKVLAVEISELYDQFAHGIQKHPLAIRNFSNFIVDQFSAGNWNAEPEHLLLIGRSFVYSKAFTDEQYFDKNLIPTYGHKGSDNLLSSRELGDYRFQLATGRISAAEPAQVKAYLDKVIEYEAALKNPGCNKDTRLWMKEVMHVGGGSTAEEIFVVDSLLSTYRGIIESPKMGNKVWTFSKGNDSAAIPLPEESIELFENGLSHVTYLGHSSGTGWSFDLPAVQFVDNGGRYPFILSISSFIGNIHEDIFGMPLEWVLHPDKGAIGFLAPVGLSFPFFQDIFASEYFRNIAFDNYGASYGICIQEAINDIYDPFQFGIKVTAHELTLQGDPAIEPYHFDYPEYLIEEGDIFFEPAVISEDADFLELKVVITNAGQASLDSLDIQINRYDPDGNVQALMNEKIPATLYQDTLSISLTNEPSFHSGLNLFEVNIDGDNVIQEECEMNNGLLYYYPAPPTSSIDRANFSQLKVIPNPATDLVSIELDKEIALINVYDQSGKLVQQSKSISNNSFSVVDLKPGMYSIEAFDQQGKSYKQQLLKQ